MFNLDKYRGRFVSPIKFTSLITEDFNVGFLMIIAILNWSFKRPRRFIFFIRIIFRFIFANIRRFVAERIIDGKIPVVLAISPTMKCNYNCIGCYSRGRMEDNELSTEELDNLFSEAENLGVPSVVVTGGEPFLRNDLLPIIENHRNLLFVVITNGSYFSPTVAKRIANSGNVIVLFSIEGFEKDTDDRRISGAYRNAIRAMELMRTVDSM